MICDCPKHEDGVKLAANDHKFVREINPESGLTRFVDPCGAKGDWRNSAARAYHEWLRHLQDLGILV
jgi:hypothetical protein